MGFCKGYISEEKIDKLREDYVLAVLDSKGINIEEFENSELYLCFFKKILFDHLYYVLHGYFNGKYDNKNEIDLNQTKIAFENNVLEVSFQQVDYKYCIIDGMLSIDGKNPFIVSFLATVNAPEIPIEKQIEAMKQFHNDMEGHRIRREDALQKSWEFAKTFKVK